MKATQLASLFSIIVAVTASAAPEAPSPPPAPPARVGLYLNVRDFGAVGDGVMDDTAAFQGAAKRCLDSGRSLFIPSGTYKITDTIVCWRWTKEEGRGSLTVLGEGARVSTLKFFPKEANSVLFEHQEWFVVKNLTVDCAAPADGTHKGIAFSTSLKAQSAFSTYENVRVRGKFKYGWFNRFTMFDQWRNIESKGPRCHFMFALSASHDTPLAPPAKGWNGGPEGWFHNLGTLDGVFCDGGEVGVAGAVMQFNFVQLTTQGQKSTGGNQILPAGAPGTGLFLTGAGPEGGALRGNTIGAFYTEATERPIFARNAGVIHLNSAFFQGGHPDPFPVAVQLENSKISISAVTLRMPFQHFAVGSTHSLCIVDLLDGAAKTQMDATSKFVNRGAGL